MFNLNLIKRKSNIVNKNYTTVPLRLPEKKLLYKKNKNVFQGTIDFRNMLHN